MRLTGGARIGPYEIQALLGAGGMGEVYRAFDTRLGRTVAVKVLGPEAGAHRKGRLRFEQEARVISSLGHPHICALFDVGEHDGSTCLVMEYLEGETLASRLLRGALPLDQTLRYAAEIADALDHAHHHGVVHRDLKPSNVMLTRQGAKLLDFGVAQARSSVIENGTTAGALTETITVEGALVGTLAYMAPEQLHGLATDARTDIFAFGAVLFEMVTGRRPFESSSRASTIAAILEHTPRAPSSLQPAVPPLLDSMVLRCLAKDPRERWQTASDLRQSLLWIANGASTSTGASTGRPRAARPRSLRIAGVAAAAAVAAAAIVAGVMYWRAPIAGSAIRFVVTPSEGTSFTQSSAFMAVSPDGRSLAFVGSSVGGRLGLWVRSLDSLVAREIAAEGVQPFWSPDSRFVGFNSRGKLTKVAVDGGVPQPLADAYAQTASWNDEGVILFKATLRGGVTRTNATGESPVLVTTPDTTRGETNHSWPYFLPDGRHFLFLATSTQPEHDGVVYAASLDASERIVVSRSDSNAAYVSPGYLVYMLGNTLVAQPFDADRLRATGDPVPIADEVERNPDSRRGAFSVSQNGVLAYRPIGNTELAWFDRTGQKLQKIGTPGRYANPALSPDDRSVAVARVDPDTGTNDVWLLDLPTGAETRVTFDAASDDMPVWSRDGRELAFRSNRGQTFAFYRKMVGSSTPETQLLKPTGLGPSLTPFGWSPDGRYFTYTAAPDPVRGRHSEIWLQPMLGDRAPLPYRGSAFNVLQAQVSPDGRWLAYASNESSRYDVYVRPFPDGDGKWQISTDGGIEPMWRSDGKELFFLAANQDLMAVSIKSGTIAQAERPVRLFRTELSSGSVISTYTRNQYVVSSDRQRILINQGAAPPSPITVVVNWTTALAR